MWEIQWSLVFPTENYGTSNVAKDKGSGIGTLCSILDVCIKKKKGGF